MTTYKNNENFISVLFCHTPASSSPKMTTIFSRIVKFSIAYPVTRGMASYAVIWPTGCLIQQVAFGDDEFDLARAARFGLFGAFYVAPTLNAWLTVARYLYPKNDLRSAIIKALIEQVTYSPCAMVSFHFGMSLLEGKTVSEAKKEVEKKFLPTYKTFQQSLLLKELRKMSN
ncbi:mpv17-like protein isoform X2 [Sipha flava]|uniref:Mpv17-like protein isoform X2 n=1 Tax=Sipha flava TaxID=143950 RepID=A0A8B8G030_9HEMI|nr:mpv17-like protein isoform X2 [Sipha flava]